MRVPVDVFPVRVNCHDDARDAVGQVQCRTHVFDEALVGNTAQVLEQIPIVAEVRTQHIWDAQREMPMKDRLQDRLGEQLAEELDFLLVA